MIQSIDRAMLIIGAMSESDKDKWLVAELAEKTGLPISTVYRLLQSLEMHDLVAQIEHTKQYELGYKWVELGLKKYEKLDIRHVARPILEKLARDVEETVYLNAPNDEVSIIVDRIDSPRNVRIIDSIGERIPMHIGAANKTMLAYAPPQTTEALLKRLIPEEDGRTEFQQQLRSIKRKGFAISRGEKTEGTLAVGAPVFDFEGRVLGAISIEALEMQTTDDQLDRFIEKVTEASEEISTAMGQSN
ncbi:IclR family transcriptional regulator [Sporosarcina sp. NCCP-2222]|uniref:IclR family transcriptional regulator n=1 Tax=Sporosarcina sp. NCCP-2222 TaxID=2935073 RepID=UPI0020802642|nr:IclR family transcriptional regulator [Sporosarcina sp. NCCP-2222]GKV57671.1 IclR family transcriptional regulator [Sporosarcina sp. NCCP-2222]